MQIIDFLAENIQGYHSVSTRKGKSRRKSWRRIANPSSHNQHVFTPTLYWPETLYESHEKGRGLLRECIKDQRLDSLVI